MNYFTVSEAAEASFIEKRSEFIGYIAPVKTNDEAVEFINSIRANIAKQSITCMHIFSEMIIFPAIQTTASLKELQVCPFWTFCKKEVL